MPLPSRDKRAGTDRASQPDTASVRDQSWQIYVCRDCEAMGLMAEPCWSCGEPLVAIEVEEVR